MKNFDEVYPDIRRRLELAHIDPAQCRRNHGTDEVCLVTKPAEFILLASILHKIDRNMMARPNYRTAARCSFNMGFHAYDAFLSLHKKLDDIVYEKIRQYSQQEGEQ